MIGIAQEAFTNQSRIKVSKEIKRFLLWDTFNYGFVYQKAYVTQNSVGIADGPGKSFGKEAKNIKHRDCTEENASITIEESSVSISKIDNVKDKPSLQQGDIATHLSSKKRQKLHWGYNQINLFEYIV